MRAAAWTSRISSTASGLSTLTMIAKRRRSRNDLAQQFESLAGKIGCLDRQTGDVAARSRQLATRPVPTGSPAAANTIGMTDVACFAARTAAVPDVTMTSTLAGRTRPRFRRSARCVPPPSDTRSRRYDPRSSRVRAAAAQSGDPLAVGRRRAGAQEPDGRQLSPAAARAPRAATPPPRRRAA